MAEMEKWCEAHELNCLDPPMVKLLDFLAEVMLAASEDRRLRCGVRSSVKALRRFAHIHMLESLERALQHPRGQGEQIPIFSASFRRK